MRTINPEDCTDHSGYEWFVLRVPAAGLCSRVLTGIDVLMPVSHSVTDEYKMKGAEKVKYISGDEGGVDGQDSTVCDSFMLFPSTIGHLSRFSTACSQ